MPFQNPTHYSVDARYEGRVDLDIDPTWTVSVTFAMVNANPMGSLTEAQRDAAFQEFIDYVAAYSHATGVTAGKYYSSGQDVTPTEAPE